MKKTLTINLNGTVFHIDEDAYLQLNDYLNAVRASLDLSDDKDEIMFDIEARIAELITEECIKQHTNIATMEMLRRIMTRMGEPKDYAMDGVGDEPNAQKQARKRYYRDTDNAMLGGVAAGLAAFLGWDVLGVRLLFVALIFVGQGWPILFYALMWMIASPALTVAQKLEMRGEPVTIDSIQHSFNEMADQTPTASTKIVKIIGTVLKVCFFMLAGFFGLIVFIVLAALLLAFVVSSIALFGSGVSAIGAFSAPFLDWSSIVTLLQPWQVVMAQVALILICVCPLIVLIAGCLSLLAKRRWTSKKFNVAFCIVWFVALCALVGALLSSVNVRQRMVDTALQMEAWEEDKDNVVFDGAYETIDVMPFNAVKAHGAVRIVLANGPQQSVAIRPGAYKSQMEVIDSVLIVRNAYDNKIEIELTTPCLERLDLQGACQLSNKNLLQTSTLSIFADGAADIDLTMQVEEFSLTANGASKMELEGTARQASFDLKGAIDVDADELCVNKLHVDIEGSADAEVWVTDSLSLEADGFSQITYKGNPTFCKRETSWGVRVKQDND